MKQLTNDILRYSLGAAALLASASTGSAFSGIAPVANPDAYTTTIGDNLSVDDPGVLSNDTDAESDTLTAVLVSSAGAAGTLFLYTDGSLEYEPAPGFVGIDTFTYVANDGTLDSAPATITFTVETGSIANPIGFTDQPTFLAAIAAQGWSITQESFEQTLWPRSPDTASSISNLGVTWTGNNPVSEITSGPGPAIFGQYGMFQLPHGSYISGTNCNVPGTCTDGWIATADSGKFQAAGLWIHCNAGQAGIEIILDGDTANPVDFGGLGLSAGSTRFYGVIAGNGFQSFEVHETEGKAEDASYIFADLFTFVKAAAPAATPYGCDVNPFGSMSVVSGAPQLGTTLVLGIDNPLGTQAIGSFPYLLIAAQPAQGFPCGPLLADFGMAAPASPGELLVTFTPASLIITRLGPPWQGTGTPVPFTLPIPSDPTIAGFSVYAQGLLFDLTPGAGIPVALTDALELRFEL